MKSTDVMWGENNYKEESETDNIIVIMDSENNYVDKDSLFKTKSNEIRYVSSPTILNGCHYFSNMKIANKHLEILHKLNKAYKTNHSFKIESINYNDTIKKELTCA
jgi:hypothetical protein